jgi:hypothetical protein
MVDTEKLYFSCLLYRQNTPVISAGSINLINGWSKNGKSQVGNLRFMSITMYLLLLYSRVLSVTWLYILERVLVLSILPFHAIYIVCSYLTSIVRARCVIRARVTELKLLFSMQESYDFH